ncbi:hypothetical protein FAB82_07040 [Glycomyces buryatensis]|uniref:Uncharacterized protein n=2 Tax=Glycomyces buryatensis TaxID=2570927 RepID=A0A4S8QFF6_9ACTN|nr:hypothetical protein FAB82_07040 [Glycomyces buryatensis]
MKMKTLSIGRRFSLGAEAMVIALAATSFLFALELEPEPTQQEQAVTEYFESQNESPLPLGDWELLDVEQRGRRTVVATVQSGGAEYEIAFHQPDDDVGVMGGDLAGVSSELFSAATVNGESVDFSELVDEEGDGGLYVPAGVYRFEFAPFIEPATVVVQPGGTVDLEAVYREALAASLEEVEAQVLADFDAYLEGCVPEGDESAECLSFTRFDRDTVFVDLKQYDEVTSHVWSIGATGAVALAVNRNEFSLGYTGVTLNLDAEGIPDGESEPVAFHASCELDPGHVTPVLTPDGTFEFRGFAEGSFSDCLSAGTDEFE